MSSAIKLIVDQSVQPELPIDVVSNVVPLSAPPVVAEAPQAPPVVETKKENLEQYEEKKQQLLEEITRLHEYQKNHSKKLQEVNDFIAQYERVVVNKKKYIENVENEHLRLAREVEDLERKKKNYTAEIDFYKERRKEIEEQYNFDKGQLDSWEAKVSAKQEEFYKAQSQVKELRAQIIEFDTQKNTKDAALQLLETKRQDCLNQLMMFEGEYRAEFHTMQEKKKDFDEWLGLRDKMIERSTVLERQLSESVVKLREEEAHWRIHAQKQQEELDRTYAQLEAGKGELEEKIQEMLAYKALTDKEKSYCASLEQLRQSEEKELERIRVKRDKLHEEVISMEDRSREYEVLVSRESILLEQMKSKRGMLEQELEQTEISIDEQKQKHVFIIQTMDNEKRLILERQEQIAQEFQAGLQHKEQCLELSIQQREIAFRDFLMAEKEKMHNHFWDGLEQRAKVLTDDLIKYVDSSCGLKMDASVEEKIKSHYKQLIKHHQTLDHMSYDKKLSTQIKFRMKHLPWIVVAAQFALLVAVLFRK